MSVLFQDVWLQFKGIISRSGVSFIVHRILMSISKSNLTSFQVARNKIITIFVEHTNFYLGNIFLCKYLSRIIMVRSPAMFYASKGHLVYVIFGTKQYRYRSTCTVGSTFSLNSFFLILIRSGEKQSVKLVHPFSLPSFGNFPFQSPPSPHFLKAVSETMKENSYE